MTALVLGILLAVSLLGIALLVLRLRAQGRTLRREAQTERAALLSHFAEEQERHAQQWRAAHALEQGRWQQERAQLLSAAEESGGVLEQARSAQQAAEARADQAAAEQADIDRELVEERAARAAAEAEIRQLGRRLEEWEDAVPPSAHGAPPAVPRELPLGRDAAADSVVDGADLGPLVVRAASVRGARHREDRQHRRDAVRLRLVEGAGAPLLLSAVAAGEPDAPLSQSGATAACRALVTQLSSGALPFTDGSFGDGRYGAGDDASVGAALRAVVAGVANSVRLVGRANTAGVVDGGEDAQVATSLYGVLSQLGDRRERRHLVFGVGAARLLRLRSESRGGSGPEDAVPSGDDERAVVPPRWTPLVTPDGEQAVRRLPAVAEDGSDVVWQWVTTRPGDVLVLASVPMARLLERPDIAEWFARRWHGRQPYLTSFLSDVNAGVRDGGGDRSVVCLWDHGHATSTWS